MDDVRILCGNRDRFWSPRMPMNICWLSRARSVRDSVRLSRCPVIAGAKRPRQRIAEPRLAAPDRSGSPGKGAVKRRPPEIG
jgi:hypothetical protein